MHTRPIRFYAQGRLHTLPEAPSTRTVLQHLREDLHGTGTKEGCAEGDCGACTVVIGELADLSAPPAPGVSRVGGLDLRNVNACIQFLPTLDGKALFTVEDLKRLAGGRLHPVQQALVECHGSQCGFCTPGFVMSLWHTYERHGCSNGSRPSRQQLADDLSGNLCRCTGYRPILDAGECMFDLPAVRFDTTPIEQALRGLQAAQGAQLACSAGSGRFFAPRTLAELAGLRLAHPQARLLAGATDLGLWVTKQMRDLGDLISLGEVVELQRVQVQDGALHIGAGATLEAAWSALVQHYPTLAELWLRFASPPIRHAGTMGGNVANGSPIGDCAPALIALDAQIVLRQGERVRRMPLADFYLDYMKNALEPGEFVQGVEVPLPRPGQMVRGYKVSKRYDSDISAVCLGLSLWLDGDTVRDVRLAYGGMAATVRRAAHAEAALRGRPWSQASVSAAMDALSRDYQPLTDMRASAGYRMKVARNLIQRAWLETRPGLTLNQRADLADLNPSEPRAACQRSTALRIDTDAEAQRLRAGQRVGVSRPHESAHLHVAGEATYTDDIPEVAGTLYAALGLSREPHARITAMNLDLVRAQPGVVAVFAAADIPGANDVGPIVHGDDPILADGRVQYLGQPVFAVVATTVEAARRAAALAKKPEVVAYESLPALLTPQAAHAAQSYVLPPMHMKRESAPGALEQALAHAPRQLKGVFDVGGQEQFYLEGQIAYARPLEDDGLLVQCSTQHPTEMQHRVAHALGLQAHHVRVECRRMGGGFGGKESQSALFACVAAVAANKLGRAVKLRVDRDDDFLITGRRHCFHYEYEVGYDDEGRVLGVQISMVSRAGFSADLSGPVMTRSLCHFDNAYWLPEVAIHGYSAKTNTQSNTAFRGFGGPQGAIAIEQILDSIARDLGRDPLDVRKLNFYAREGQRTPYGQAVEDNVIHELVDTLERSSDYRARREAVRAFNAASPVLKKGLALTPVKFGISFNLPHLNQAGALVHVYSDGSILVNHGGTEMGQGLNTKVAQVVAHELGVNFERVRCSATDTDKVANTSATAASTGADLNGKAAQDAARRIRERLAALAAQKYGGRPQDVRFANDTVTVGDMSLSFSELVWAAYLARVQLWSDGFYATPSIHWDPQTLTGHPFYYFAYGAAVAEVIVDTLTGEARTLRADVLHDAGRPLNPALDIGQVEGAFIQGMGWLTTEELWWHPETGRLMTHAPSTYKIPTANDVPPVFKVQLLDAHNREDSIHRSKAVGEPPLLLPFSVFYAIRDAVSAVGEHRVDPPLRAPATAEAILAAIEAVRQGA